MVKDAKRAIGIITSNLVFPRLRRDNKFKVTSNININYNCIAWAMRLGDRWVDTTRTAGHWWPLPVDSLSMQKEGLICAFEALKFKKCDNSDRELWYDKVSLYCHPVTGAWTHAARILSPEEYHSKLGGEWDIHHSNGGVLHNPLNMANTYGNEYQVMKRHKFLRVYSLWLTLIRLANNIWDGFRGLL